MKTLFLDGLIYELPYADLLPELSPSQFAELKEDIRDKGCNVYPVLLRFPHPSANVRRVIDGGHRLRAVYELRNEGNASVLLEVQSLNLENEEEERQAALDLNLKRRQLTPEERLAAIVKLRQEGKSIRQISETTGISKSQVSRELSTVPDGTVELPSVVTGKDGKERQAHRPVSSPAGEHRPAAFACTDESMTAGAKILVTDENGDFDPLATHLLNQQDEPQEEPTEFEKKTAPLMAQLIQEERDKKGDVDELRAEIEKLRAENELLRKKKAPAIAASDRDDHNTPPELLAVIRAFGGDQITLDPCSNQNSKVKALIELTKEEDGLRASWSGLCAAELPEGAERGLVFVNPPYDQASLSHVNAHAHREALPWLDIITLVPVKADQPWFQEALAGSASAVCFVAGRVRFWADGKQQSGAAFESALFYYGDRSAEFCDCFGEEIGVCLDLKLYREARGAA